MEKRGENKKFMPGFFGLVKNPRRKAMFFSLDALIALIIILLVVVFAYPALKHSRQNSELEGDIIKTLSLMKIGDINNSYIKSLRDSGKISDYNKSVLEQIGEFYVTDKSIAKQMAESILASVNTSENIGIWYGTYLIASRNNTPFETARTINVERQIISGINDSAGVTAFSARAYLVGTLSHKYFYFGGYTGDGNISAIINYSGEISDVVFEIAVNRDFNLSINGNWSGHYQNSSGPYTPQKFNATAYKSYFHPGVNTMEFMAPGMYLGGGFIKISYNNSEVYQRERKTYFPGIDGLVNLYGGFYVPALLNSMEVYLHLNTPYRLLLTIGNVTVFNRTTSGEESITLSNAQLDALLDYSSLSQKTVPLRLGLENITYIGTRIADVYSIAELSGSTHANDNGKKQLEWIKEGNEAFIVSVLNYTGSRVGLVAYDKDAENLALQHNLSSNVTSLNDTIYSWDGGAPTCICCGLNKGLQRLINESNSSRYWAMVLMSDGNANGRCNTTAGDAKSDAIASACNASAHNVTVNVIGYGNSKTIDNITLQAIAACGKGQYYYSTATELADTYREAAKFVIQAAYEKQRLSFIGEWSSRLWPDSYIELGYTNPPLPHGLINSFEKKFTDSYSGSFLIPDNSSILEVTAISYSGERWTDNVTINGTKVFNLGSYGPDYVKLGDPYAINIPTSYVGKDNTVGITTGIAPGFSYEGSSDNKIIYKIIRDVSSYSRIVHEVSGCIWKIDFEDGTSLEDKKIPAEYSGTENCYYQTTGQNVSKGEGDDGDAMQLAVLNLLRKLDLDLNGKIDIKFTEEDLEIESSEMVGIPYTWDTEVQVRRWLK